MDTNSFAYKFKVFKIKLFSWEYWPMYFVYLPASIYYFYLSLKAKSFFFFSAANPSIQTGGMFFESKWDIFKLIPKRYFPTTVFINPTDSIEVIIQRVMDSNISYPFIAKPDRGERGWAVKRIHDQTELIEYHNQTQVTYLIQRLVTFPLEYSIFYYRHPATTKGIITSVTRKEYLSITGDGKSTILALIEQNSRALLQLKKLRENSSIDFNKVLVEGEKHILVPFGNHVRGAMFLDDTHLINTTFTETFDHISHQIDGFYFGRFDIKCASKEDLIQGKNMLIVELNGAGAEPSHIYQPGFSFFKAQKNIVSHFKMMYDAAVENQKRGTVFMTLKEYRNTRKAEKQYKNKVRL